MNKYEKESATATLKDCSETLDGLSVLIGNIGKALGAELNNPSHERDIELKAAIDNIIANIDILAHLKLDGVSGVLLRSCSITSYAPNVSLVFEECCAPLINGTILNRIFAAFVDMNENVKGMTVKCGNIHYTIL